jgi:4-diphosphocytidyl-2-C-methyl-D-erythritol kinase
MRKNFSSLRLPSFAKVNCYLRVLGKRPDGYHEIRTVLQTVSLHDDLDFSLRDDEQIVFQCDSPDIPLDKTNLVLRSAEILKSRAREFRGVNLDLTKRIPTKAGLGGASSNAAVALMGLNWLWDCQLETSELVSLASAIGSDVPFFFAGGLALGEGTGTTISSLEDTSKRHMIIVTPRVGVSTQAAYQALNAPSLTTSGSDSILSSSFWEATLKECELWTLQNDFEGVIFEIEPEIKRAKEALIDAGAQGGLLAGSGSSVFGVFGSEDGREKALSELKCEQGWRVFSCETISRTEYADSLNSSGFPLFTLS